MEEKFKPIYCEINEIYISQIIFEKSFKSNDVTIFGYFFSENTQELESVSYWCEFSILTELLNIAKEEGEIIIDMISEKLSNFEMHNPIIIDIENIYGSCLKIENVCLTTYRPQQNLENGEKSFEDDEEFYIIDSLIKIKR
jgi:hypothetical protein